MSDRVRFLTRTGPFAPANSSGCNGFPFPTIAAIAPGYEIYYPSQFTLPKAVELWWRVREFKLVTDFAVSIDDYSGTQSGGFDGLQTSGNSTARELELISLSPPPPKQFHGALAGGGAGTFTSNFDLYLFGDFAGHSDPATALYRHGADYFPYVQISGFVRVLMPSGHEAVLAVTSYDPGGFPSVAGTLLGREIRIYYDEISPGVIDGVNLNFTHSRFAIEGASYWPYAGLDGRPIYDTTTGELLPSGLPPPAPQFRSPLD